MEEQMLNVQNTISTFSELLGSMSCYKDAYQQGPCILYLPLCLAVGQKSMSFHEMWS